MLEGKALVVAIMMLTAAPIAATDQGQAFIGDVTYEIGEVFNDEEEETKVVDKVIDEADIKDKELLLTDEKIEEDCLTLEQWKETLVPEEKIDEEKAEARGDKKESDKKESDEKKESDVAKEEWTDKKEVIDEEACLSAEEWALKFESDEDKEEPCFTFEELEEKMKGERKHHKKGWDRFRHDEDKEWDREDRDWDEDEEFRLYLAELSEACDEGDEESCEELLAVREELAADREEEDREREDEDEEERSRNSDESENEEVREDEEKEFDEETCLTMEEWKEILDDDKEEDKQWDNDRKEKGPHRDAFVREMIEELEIACEEEGNEQACQNFEAMIANIEEVEEKVVDITPELNKPISNSRFESYNIKSYAMIDAFQSVLDSSYGESIDVLSVVNGTLSAQGSVDITGLLIDVDLSLIHI